MDSDLFSAIDSSAKNLLDTSKRNPYLNFSRKSAIIFEQSCYEKILSCFFERKSTLNLKLPKQDSLPIDPNHLPFFNSSDFTIYGSEESFQKNIRLIYSASNLALKEKGVSIAFMCFGFLQYKDSSTPGSYNDDSGKDFFAPLIVFPVSISRESIQGPYTITPDYSTGCDSNLTLAIFMKQRFQLDWPQFADDDTPQTYLEKIRPIIEHRGWTLSSNFALARLNYQKIAMYHDLIENKSTIASSPMTKLLFDNEEVDIGPSLNDLARLNLDTDLEPYYKYNVMDADSSQERAIAGAMKGASIIIQGPPGTGKSQTITNIIANALASKKSILFVAEKQEALDVVYRNLQHCPFNYQTSNYQQNTATLGDFCLPLHDVNTNKKDTLAVIKNTLRIKDNFASSIQSEDFSYHYLDYYRKGLNDFDDEIHKRIQPLNCSIYEAYGIVADIKPEEYHPFYFENLNSMTRSDFDSIERLLDDLSKLVPGKANSLVLNNAWHHYLNRNGDFALTVSLKETLSGAISKTSAFVDEINDIFGLLAIHPTNSLYAMANIKNLNSSFSSLEMQPQVKASFFETIHDKDSLVDKGNQLGLLDEYLKEQMQAISAKLLNSKPVFDIFSLPYPLTLSSLNQIKDCLSLCQKTTASHPEISSLSEKLTNDHVSSLLKEYWTYVDTKDSIEKKITHFFQNDFLTYDVAPIQEFFLNNKGKSLVLNGAYHRYKKNIESYLIKKRLFVSRDFLESMVSSLLQYQHSLIQISQSLGTLKTALGSLACEVDNRDEISSIVKACIPFDSLIKFMADYKDCETQWSNCLNALACFMDIPKNGSIIDYQKIQSNISWGLAIQELLINHAISKDTIHEIYTNPMLPSLLAEKEIKLKSTWMDYLSATRWYQNNFDDAQDTGSENILAFLEKVRSLQTNENDFGLWASYLQEKGRLNILGLKSYLDLLEDPASKIESKDIKRIFEKTFSKMWLDDKTSSSEYPAIKQFSGRNQDSCVSYFCTLDKEQFSAATEQIATTQLTNRIDEVTTNRYNYDAQRLKNEMKSLRHETQKLRRIITTRQLFQQDFDAVINVTPCLMMSPLAVSTFITPGTRFDLVIFDEASQVPAEEAIGAIYRGKQLIVAGDEEQLPPTSFFNSQVNIASDDLAFEDEGNVADFSSILKLLNGGQLSKNNMMLQWHYRSRDESLIAFSNAKIYGNQLVTFPSPINAVSEERGVKLDFVSNGVWENQRIGNPIEAKEVAKMVMAFFEKYGDKETGLLKYSLGVVAFGITQSDAIEEALDLLMEDKPSYEKCRSQDVPEPFFIKNLETVQGDQRDFIILDVGYGRNPDGTTSMRFGPLNQLNGYKRLNVAITRAKFGITLVSSIHGSDLSIVENTERTRGLQLLHDYLVYAEPENGMAWLKQQESQGASINFNNKDGFCDIVYNFLINKGYKVVRNVGCSSYRIDFGIEDPKIGGNFYLGIECDGNTYHSAHNARERDRLRSEVLHRMGWNLFRLWSTEWVRNPKLAQDSLIQAINNAFTEYTEKQAAALAEKEKQDTLIKEKANDNQEDQQIKPAPEEDLFPEFTGTSEKDEDENANSDSSVDEDSDTSKVSTTSQATTTNGVIFTNDSFLPLNAKTEPMENSAEKETNSSEPETKQEDLSGSPIPWAPRKEFPEGVIDIIIQLSKLPITFYFQYSEVEMPRKSLLKMLGSYHFEDEYYIVACNSLFHYFKDITISRSYRISLEKKYHSEIEPLDKTRAKAAFVLYKAYSIQAEIRKFEIAENVTIIDNPSAFLVSFEKINPKTEADLSKLSGINSHFNLCLTKISYRLSELEKYTLPYGKIINTR